MSIPFLRGTVLSVSQTVPILSAPSCHFDLKEDECVWKALLKLADQCAGSGDYHRTYQLWDRAILYAADAHVTEGEVGIALKKSADHYFAEGNLFRSLLYAKKASECFFDTTMSHQLHLAETHELLAAIYFSEKDFPNFEASSFAVLAILERHPYNQSTGHRKKYVVRLYRQLAMLYQYMQNFIKAEAFYLRALRHCDFKGTKDEQIEAAKAIFYYKLLLEFSGRDDEAKKLTDEYALTSFAP